MPSRLEERQAAKRANRRDWLVSIVAALLIAAIGLAIIVGWIHFRTM